MVQTQHEEMLKMGLDPNSRQDVEEYNDVVVSGTTRTSLFLYFSTTILIGVEIEEQRRECESR